MDGYDGVSMFWLTSHTHECHHSTWRVEECCGSTSKAKSSRHYFDDRQNRRVSIIINAWIFFLLDASLSCKAEFSRFGSEDPNTNRRKEGIHHDRRTDRVSKDVSTIAIKSWSHRRELLQAGHVVATGTVIQLYSIYFRLQRKIGN